MLERMKRIGGEQHTFSGRVTPYLSTYSPSKTFVTKYRWMVLGFLVPGYLPLSKGYLELPR